MYNDIVMENAEHNLLKDPPAWRVAIPFYEFTILSTVCLVHPMLLNTGATAVS